MSRNINPILETPRLFITSTIATANGISREPPKFTYQAVLIRRKPGPLLRLFMISRWRRIQRDDLPSQQVRCSDHWKAKTMRQRSTKSQPWNQFDVIYIMMPACCPDEPRSLNDLQVASRSFQKASFTSQKWNPPGLQLCSTAQAATLLNPALLKLWHDQNAVDALGCTQVLCTFSTVHPDLFGVFFDIVVYYSDYTMYMYIYTLNQILKIAHITYMQKKWFSTTCQDQTEVRFHDCVCVSTPVL